VVLVSDIDVLTGAFLQIRSMGIDEEAFENFHPDNVTFILNALDVLAGDERFVDVRNRRRKHRTLKQIEERTADAREKADKQREKFINQFKDEIAKEQKNLNDQVAKIEKRTDIDQMQKNQEKTQVMVVLNQRLEVKQKELERSRDKELQRIDRELVLSKRAVQDWFKMWAVLLPPIFPMLIGVVVFFNRRANEREGVSRSRLRKGMDG
jgi:ABC-2 type transport system permease protein